MKTIVDSFWRVFMFLDDIIYVTANISNLRFRTKCFWGLLGWLLQISFLLVSCCLNWKENRKNLFPQTSGRRHSLKKSRKNFILHGNIVSTIGSYEFTANLSTGRRRRKRVDNLVARAWIAAKSASLWKLQPGYGYFCPKRRSRRRISVVSVTVKMI